MTTAASISLAESLSQLINVDQADIVKVDNVADETRLSNDVMIYDNSHEIKILSNLMKEFPTLWKNEGFVNIPEENWMKLSLRDDWQSRLSKSNRAKIYPLGINDRAMIDETFDDLQRQGRLEYIIKSTSFSYPVFVVWKTLPNGKRKGRAVVDIRDLNDLIVSDVYLVSLQTDIIARLLGCTHLSILDAMSFFYQWLIHLNHRYMLTMISHRGQKIFNVSIMGYMNFIVYVQRQIDKILRSIKDFAQAYIDDIVVEFKSLREHIAYLRRLFQLLIEYNIVIASIKTFLNYSNINLLDRKVDSFDMTTAENKLKTISEISYPSTLGDLEYYLELTDYLRSFIHYYAQLVSSLQNLKTRLLKQAPIKDNSRRAYLFKMHLSETSSQEEQSFNSL